MCRGFCECRGCCECRERGVQKRQDAASFQHSWIPRVEKNSPAFTSFQKPLYQAQQEHQPLTERREQPFMSLPFWRGSLNSSGELKLGARS